jgi:uncharacterized OB-fold protein
MTDEYAKPLPSPTAVSRPYWEGAREHRLTLPSCRRCGDRFFYPRAVCPRCLSDEIDWLPASGSGVVYSFTIIRQATTRGFEGDVPYAYAIIELEEGVRLQSNVVGCAPEDVRCGMAVEVVFDDVTPEITLPRFRPAAG